MRFIILVALVSCIALAQCDDNSLLQNLSALDLTNVIKDIFGTNFDSLRSVERSQATNEDQMLREREYDWDKCMIDLGSIADGLNRTEMWAMQGEKFKSFPHKIKTSQQFSAFLNIQN